jgi:hypothetical protein
MLTESGRIITEVLIGALILIYGIIGISKNLGLSLRSLNRNLTTVDQATDNYPSNQNSACTPKTIPGFGKIIRCSTTGANSSFIIFER